MTAATISLTAVLVLVTAYYAWQTRQMVTEMEDARRDQLRALLVPALAFRGAGRSMFRIQNVGLGPATSIVVTLRLDDGRGWSRPWLGGFLAPGEFVDLLPPKGEQGLLTLDRIIERYEHLTLEGSCRNGLNEAQQVDATINIRAMWEATKTADVLVPYSPTKEMNRHLSEIENALKSLASSGKRIEYQMGEDDVDEYDSPPLKS